jgi:hypothetical protein
MDNNQSTSVSTTHVGKAVFEAGEKTVNVEFDTIAELREIEDDLTWEHWPAELNLVSMSYHPAEKTAVKQAGSPPR